MDDPIVALFKAVDAKGKRERAAIRDISDKIGHNGGPLIGEPFGIKAAWIRFAKDVEVRRLAKLHMRIERRKASLKVLTDERRTKNHNDALHTQDAQGKR